MIQQVSRPFEIALDIGHSSIGWAVFQNGEKFDLLGTGVVSFPADDCLAIKRRAYRRQRRHVRATRQRIERLKRLLLHVGVLSEAELNEPGCAWPWKLAAEVLSGSGRVLTWRELWDVLRWYAHNRGYDGNARWSRLEEIDADDTEKEKKAISLMVEHGTKTMAETFCSALKISPLGIKKSSRERFKGLNAAFPRHIVYAEAKSILEKHVGVLPKLTLELVRTLVGNDNSSANEWDDDAWKTVRVPEVEAYLPKRYKGSYLFGQSVPRFDNRIISSCPITYQRVLAETGDASRATRDSKVPVKKCREFLLYRWAMILANLRVNKGRGMEPLTGEERKAIHAAMVKEGHLTKKELKKVLNEQTGALLGNNVDTCFLVPRAEEALKLRPSKKELPSGRAPYTRQVMKQAIREVFEGKHPTEKGNSLYLSDGIKQAQLQRTLDEKTNNHLVRHRILIMRRLVQDIIKSYMNGNAAQVERITIEVNRDLQTFSGKTNKEIEGELNQMIKDHSGVVKKLKEHLTDTKYRITAGLIRKARIAEDLNWTCPYSQKRYGAIELASGAFDKDHIIPRSLRPSDSLESLVITTKAINAMKGNRTALQFIQEFEGKDIEGDRGVGKEKSNLTTLLNYKKFVEKLSIKANHRQDADRKKKRKALLLLEKYVEKEFLGTHSTQTSHLTQLTREELEKEFQDLKEMPSIIPLSGFITAEVRRGWNLIGCLLANPVIAEEYARKESEVLAKGENINQKLLLRGITHQHHALDACVIGYASHFLPDKDGLWKILGNRNRKSHETEVLIERGIFLRDGKGIPRLAPLRDEFRQQIIKRLGECRVVQHIPKRMGGLAGLEENTRGIVAIEVPDAEASSGKESKLKEIWNNESGQPLPILEKLDGVIVKLQRFGPRDSKNNDKRERPPTYEKAAKLLGLCPKDGKGKLRAIKGVRVIDANFGVALWQKNGQSDGKLQSRVILWHKVWPQLKAIAEHENGGKWPQVVRNGQIIKVLNTKAKGRSDYRGHWKIRSIKNSDKKGLIFDMSRPDMIPVVDKVGWAKREVALSTLIACGMTVVSSGLTGVPLNM